MKRKNDKKIIVILGPTASGKSDLAVKIAKKYGGEVISADSRQVYKGMDIGTGKITKKEMHGIPHYLLDVASPKKIFTVEEYKKFSLLALKDIMRRGKLPIVCGGTGFYIQALVDGIIIPKVVPDWKLRAKLEKKSAKYLYGLLKKLDPNRAKTIDKNNPRRLIRAVEIIKKTKKEIPPLKSDPLPYPVLFVGIAKTKDELGKLIRKRLLKRLGGGMLNETKKLKKLGISWKRLKDLGLEYKWMAEYLQKEINYDEMINGIQKDSKNYAKRQMTWFKKDKRIHWVKNHREIEDLLKKFMQN